MKATSCRFPQHHKSDGDDLLPVVVGVVLAAAAAAVVVAVVRIVAGFVLAHLWQIAGPFVGLVLVRLAVAVVRFARLDAAGRRHWLPARWHRLTWKRLSRNLGLSYVDKHLGGVDSSRRRKVNHPRVKFRPDSFGWVVKLKLTPGVGRAEVEKAAEHLANRWRCVRVGVDQPCPGRLVVRAMRRDPLAEPLSADVLPPTESAASLAVQLVPSPAVELYILDGGACDWAPFAGAAVAYSDDNLADAEELLLELHSQMMTRRRQLEADLGTRNAWKVGPSPDYPLRWLLVEEASWFFDLEAVKGDRDRERHVRACRALVAQLLRRGRAPMHHCTLVVQKPVGAGGLRPELRDLCGARWCFGVATDETASAALGSDIRQYDTLSPTRLQGPEHVGVATVLLKSGLLPYTMVKFPEIGDLADEVARQAANRRRLAPD